MGIPIVWMTTESLPHVFQNKCGETHSLLKEHMLKLVDLLIQTQNHSPGNYDKTIHPSICCFDQCSYWPTSFCGVWYSLAFTRLCHGRNNPKLQCLTVVCLFLVHKMCWLQVSCGFCSCSKLCSGFWVLGWCSPCLSHAVLMTEQRRCWWNRTMPLEASF